MAENRLLALMDRDRARLGEMAADLQGPRFDWGRGYADSSASPPEGNLVAADQAMRLSPQEDALYRRHLSNLYGKGGVDNADGSRSSLYQATIGVDGKHYSIPTVWDGQVLPPRQAADQVDRIGWDKFPAYATPDEAASRYDQLHGFMERDTSDYLRNR